MKLEIKHGNVVTSEDFKAFTFGIRSADTGIILEILRSKMYKNPIAAICREIASNARDANKEVGNKDPICISIDEGNIFEHICESSISFSDKGPGISPERMADVFVNYGASTKRDDNRQLGGFGLGAKTPFAYTDNFTIITIVNGKKYQYVAAIEENNTGKMYHLEKTVTDESNGTTIIIPIRKEDIRLFKQELIKATYFWPIKPILNFNYELDIHCTHVQNGILLKDNNGLFTSNLYALIDGVPYEVDSDKITPVQFSSYTIMLTFKTGTLGISANRESIRYDDSTLKKIQEKYEQFIKNLQEHTQSEIDSAQNYYEAAIKLYKIIQSDEFTKILYDNNIVPSYKGQKVDFHLHLTDDLQLYKSTDSSSNSKKIITRLEQGMSVIYVIDVNKPTSGRNLTIHNNIGSNTGFYYLDVSNKLLKSFSNQNFSTKKNIVKTMRRILNQINWFKSIGLTLVNYSSIKPTRIIKEQRTLTVIPSKILRNSGERFTIYGGKHLITSKVNINSISPDTHAYHIYEEKMLFIDRQILTWANVCQICGINILFVSNRRGSQLSKIIKNLMETIDHLDKTKATQISDAYVTSQFKNSLESFSAFDFGPAVKSSIELIKRKSKSISADHLPNDFIAKYPPSSEILDAIKLIQSIKAKYPLIQK